MSLRTILRKFTWSAVHSVGFVGILGGSWTIQPQIHWKRTNLSRKPLQSFGAQSVNVMQPSESCRAHPTSNSQCKLHLTSLGGIHFP